MPNYRLHSTEPRNDGSGDIAWDIEALSNDGVIIPGRHITILIPADETEIALTPPGVGPKLIALLLHYRPELGWDNDELDEMAEANALAIEVDVKLDDYVSNYPKDFNV